MNKHPLISIMNKYPRTVIFVFIMATAFAFVIMRSSEKKQKEESVFKTGDMEIVSPHVFYNEYNEIGPVHFYAIDMRDSLGNHSSVGLVKDSVIITGDTMMLIKKWLQLDYENVKRHWIGVVLINNGDTSRLFPGDTIRVTKNDAQIKYAVK